MIYHIFDAINSRLQNFCHLLSSHFLCIFWENNFIGSLHPVEYKTPQIFTCEQTISSSLQQGCIPFRFKGFSPTHLSRTPVVNRFTYGIVVEPSSIRSLAADCPLNKDRGFNLVFMQLIFSVFTTVTLMHISSLRCGLIAFRIFQQLNTYFIIQLTLYGHCLG